MELLRQHKGEAQSAYSTCHGRLPQDREWRDNSSHGKRMARQQFPHTEKVMIRTAQPPRLDATKEAGEVDHDRPPDGGSQWSGVNGNVLSEEQSSRVIV